jgi:hypothetical protein
MVSLLQVDKIVTPKKHIAQIKQWQYKGWSVFEMGVGGQADR